MKNFQQFSLSVCQFVSKPVRQFTGKPDYRITGQLINRSTGKQKPGFTLVELLLSMGIFTILMTIIFQVFLSVIETRLSAEAASATTQDAQYVYSRLAYDISRSSAVVTPASPGQSSSTLQLTINGTSYTYAIDGSSHLNLTTGGTSTAVTSAGSKATAATFTRRGGATGAQSVTFDITLNSAIVRAGSGAVVRHVTGTVGTR
jgi:prepilin-type N-terminal cleavage/methylation domain-containing protein